ncbi:hypothetical protein CAPTEDRAFT_129800 [Capitella teleta]|uniref:pyridoxal 5'-phosphate synthase n=1 Tax=Capitella teleta TaxID=283909 RepID=R7V2G7_CAPTE|nr:hypothetical protein CAPTEDRAFT_129800 [Capitella teleta]|eukprot:ELU12709.1 hypothetical protein CAPTEDRAFT_129800 [Capitella teleta]
MPIKEPLALFQKWFEEAQYSDGIHLATSMTLATASKAGRPSSRIVGVKGFDKSGFKIATNKNSRKAKDMDENPFASLMFYWESMNRMVRIDGPVEKLDTKATSDIWKGFPRAAQLTHSASKQDDILPDKSTLVQKKAELTQQYADSTPIPPNPEWCAYNLIPDWWEFYQVVTDLPDRIIFRKPEAGETPDGKALHQGDEGWILERVYP